MAPLPANSILRASVRWVEQLRQLSPERARAMLTAHAKYSDLTSTQYEAAFDWLKLVGFVTGAGKIDLSALSGALSDEAAILEVALAHAQPAWVQDADHLIGSAQDFPEDLASATEALSLDPQEGLAVVRQVWGKVDTARREEVGAAGEHALLRQLQHNTSGDVIHVAARADGYGFDIAVRVGSRRANLEVKSTTRRGRLTFHLSRNEHEVMLRDPNWHLVVVLLDDSSNLVAVGTVDQAWVRETAPGDSSGECRWQSARYEASPNVTRPGLAAAIPWALPSLPAGHVLATGYLPGHHPSWFQAPLSKLS